MVISSRKNYKEQAEGLFVPRMEWREVKDIARNTDID